MNEYRIERLLSQLERKLGIDYQESRYEQLSDSIENAYAEMKLYLNCKEIPCVLDRKLVELAAIDFQQTQARESQPVGAKSSSYSEGDVSQSVTFLTAQEAQAAKDAVLRSIAHYRRRATWS